MTDSNNTGGASMTMTRFSSADDTVREISPSGYYPNIRNGLIYDDEAEWFEEEGELPKDTEYGIWYQLFAGGNNRLHFIRFVEGQEIQIVEQAGFGIYEGKDERYENAYDAFYSYEV